jgi:hypothetical protein
MTGYKHTEATIQKIKEKGRLFREANPNHYETYREKHKQSMKKVDISTSVKQSEKIKKALANHRKDNNKMREETIMNFKTIRTRRSHIKINIRIIQYN